MTYISLIFVQKNLDSQLTPKLKNIILHPLVP